MLKITSTNFSVGFEQNDNGKIGKSSNMAVRFHFTGKQILKLTGIKLHLEKMKTLVTIAIFTILKIQSSHL